MSLAFHQMQIETHKKQEGSSIRLKQYIQALETTNETQTREIHEIRKCLEKEIEFNRQNHQKLVFLQQSSQKKIDDLQVQIQKLGNIAEENYTSYLNAKKSYDALLDETNQRPKISTLFSSFFASLSFNPQLRSVSYKTSNIFQQSNNLDSQYLKQIKATQNNFRKSFSEFSHTISDFWVGELRKKEEILINVSRSLEIQIQKNTSKSQRQTSLMEQFRKLRENYDLLQNEMFTLKTTMQSSEGKLKSLEHLFRKSNFEVQNLKVQLTEVTNKKESLQTNLKQISKEKEEILLEIDAMDILLNEHSADYKEFISWATKEQTNKKILSSKDESLKEKVCRKLTEMNDLFSEEDQVDFRKSRSDKKGKQLKHKTKKTFKTCPSMDDLEIDKNLSL